MSKHGIMVTACGMCITMLVLWSLVSGADVTPIPERPTVQPYVSPPSKLKVDPDDYTGWIRLYIVEPDARWKDHNNNGYHFGFLEFGLDSAVVLPDLSRYYRSVTWDASASGWSGVTEGNIMVIAAIFNSEPHQAYSDPPSGNPFNAYYVDAAAAAEAGSVDSNNTTPASTHTVLVEEASANYCPYCPTTNYYLHSVYSSGNYNFVYATMVIDKNSKASAWMNSHYNLAYIPACYGDGGDEVLIGGVSPQGPYQTMINACAGRTVSDIGLIVGVDWLGGGVIKINVALAHGTPVDTPPGMPVTPSGDTAPLIQTEYNYSTSASDPESDELYYQWDWGDGDTSAWLGPYNSEDTCMAAHSWADLGTYQVKVKSRDPWYEGGWSNPLTVIPTCCIGNRGNVDGDGGDQVNVGDLTYLVDYLFRGGPPPPCTEEANVDGDLLEQVNVGDLTYLVDYLFRAGPPPPSCP